MTNLNKTITIIGAGSWGTSLAITFCENHFNVRLWAYEKEVVHSIQCFNENRLYLPGVSISPSLLVTHSLEEALKHPDIILFAVPSHVLRGILKEASLWIKQEVPIISAIKGIENESLLLPTQIMTEILPEKFHSYLSALSGPTFARETALKQPTAAVLAAVNLKMAKSLQKLISAPFFRIYISEDLTGVQLGGALKNVMAVAAGCSDGLGFGDNTRAALMTRGLSEMIRLGVAMGARQETFSGLSGLGDLILTSTSPQSRNRTLGYKIGKGIPLATILSETITVAEGVKTTHSAYHLAKRYQVEMPITEQLYLILFKNKDPKKAVIELINRPAYTEGIALEF